VGEALDALATEDDAIVMAGGQSLVPLLSIGLADPAVIVSLDRCHGLNAVHEAPDSTRVGAMVTARAVELDPRFSRFGLLSHAAGRIASPHVRNFGTVVGNVCHADPGGDLIPVLTCLGASIELESLRGIRSMEVADFVESAFVNRRSADELATSITVPFRPAWNGFGYRKIVKRDGDLAMVTCAVLVAVEARVIVDARICIGGAVGVARRLADIEAAAVGSAVDVIGGAVDPLRLADELGADVLDDPSSPGDYLIQVLPRVVAATLEDAVRDHLADG
jgi:carbon-monoxide dehydrogenase medium subunit